MISITPEVSQFLTKVTELSANPQLTKKDQKQLALITKWAIQRNEISEHSQKLIDKITHSVSNANTAKIENKASELLKIDSATDKEPQNEAAAPKKARPIDQRTKYFCKRPEGLNSKTALAYVLAYDRIDYLIDQWYAQKEYTDESASTVRHSYRALAKSYDTLFQKNVSTDSKEFKELDDELKIAWDQLFSHLYKQPTESSGQN